MANANLNTFWLNIASSQQQVKSEIGIKPEVCHCYKLCVLDTKSLYVYLFCWCWGITPGPRMILIITSSVWEIKFDVLAMYNFVRKINSILIEDS